MNKIVFCVVILSVLLAPALSLAAAGISIENPLKYDTFEELIDAVITLIFYISLVLAPVMIIIGAFKLLTSAGNPVQVKSAQNIFLWTAVGVLVVFMARGLVALINAAVRGT